MSENTTVQTGIPERSSVVDLLNGAYGWWGTEELFEWKYDDYPGFEPNEDCYYIEADGELAAFRRVFRKHIRTEDGRVPLFVLGDTAVRKSHRGRGLYSKLHEVTTDYCRSEGGVISTFNRVGNLTYKANLDRGWEFRTLPLQMKILDFSNVIGQYARKVIQPETYAHTLLTAGDGLVALRTLGGDELALTERTMKRDGSDRRIPIPIPKSVLQTVVEIASQDSLLSGVRKGVARPKKTVTGGGQPSGISELSARSFESLTDDQWEEVANLYATSSTCFGRTDEDIEHVLQHPDAEAVLVRDGSRLVAFTALVSFEQPYTTEGRVLELYALTETAGYRAARELERLGRENQYDLLLVSSPIDIERWIDIERQVFMWDPDSVPQSLGRQISDARISLYDAV